MFVTWLSLYVWHDSFEWVMSHLWVKYRTRMCAMTRSNLFWTCGVSLCVWDMTHDVFMFVTQLSIYVTLLSLCVWHDSYEWVMSHLWVIWRIRMYVCHDALKFILQLIQSILQLIQSILQRYVHTLYKSDTTLCCGFFFLTSFFLDIILVCKITTHARVNRFFLYVWHGSLYVCDMALLTCVKRLSFVCDMTLFKCVKLFTCVKRLSLSVWHDSFSVCDTPLFFMCVTWLSLCVWNATFVWQDFHVHDMNRRLFFTLNMRIAVFLNYKTSYSYQIIILNFDLSACSLFV